jgi:hypothetical protein
VVTRPLLAAVLALLTACSSLDPWAEYEPFEGVSAQPVEEGTVRVGVRIWGVDATARHVLVRLRVRNRSEAAREVTPVRIAVRSDEGELLEAVAPELDGTVVLAPAAQAEWSFACAADDSVSFRRLLLEAPHVLWEVRFGTATVGGESGFVICDPPHLQDEGFDTF